MLFFNFGIFAWKMAVATSVAPEGLGSQNPVKKLVHFIYLSDQLLSQNKVFTIFEPDLPLKQLLLIFLNFKFYILQNISQTL